MAKPIKIVGKIVKWGLLGLAALIAGVVLLATFMDWNRLKPYIESAVTEQTGREFAIAGDLTVDVWSWRPHLRVERVRFENAPWGEPRQMVRLRAFDVSVDLVALIKGNVVIPALIIDRPIVHLARSGDGKGNWQVESNAAAGRTSKPAAGSGDSSELPAILKLVVWDGELTYREPAAEQAMTLVIANISGSTHGPGGNVTLDGRGRLRKQAWRLDFKAGSLDELLAANAPYPVELDFDMGDTRARVNGTLDDPARLAGGNIDFSLRGPGLKMLSAFLGPDAPRLPPYSLEGHVARAGQTWQVKDFQARVGESDLHGELSFEPVGQRPTLKADLASGRLDYGDFAGLAPPSKPERMPERPKPFDLSPLRSLDAVVKLRGDEIVMPTVDLEDVRADVRLRDGRLRIAPLAIGVADGRVRTQATLDARSQPFQATVQAELEQVDLAKLREMANASQALEGIVNGRVGISITGASRAQMKQNAAAGALAAIDSLTIDDSQLTYEAPGRDTELRVTADTVTREGRRQIELQGSGRYRGEPFTLDFRADPLLALADTQSHKPYAIDLKASGAKTEITATGTLRHPLALKAVDIELSAQGSGTDRLAAALGKPLPNLPPYNVGGRVSRQGTRWIIDDFDGRVGESDLQGDIALTTGGNKPFIKADLVSRRLDHADFAAVLGAESGQKEATAKTKEAKTTEPAADRPAEPPFNLAPLQRFNADISFEGREIIAPNLPLEDIAIDLALRDGQLTIEPFTLGIGGGTVKGTLGLDSATPIHGNLTTTIDQVDVQQIVEPFDLKSKFGVLDGHTEIAIVGSDEAQIAAAAEQTALTFIHSLVIEDTRLAYVDPNSGIDIELTMRTTETSDGAEPIMIDGSGRYQGEAFNMHVGAGSLLRLLEEIRPYPIEARAEVAETIARLKGDVTRPLDMKGLDVNLSIKGPNPSRLEKLAGLPLPDLPPYAIKGELFRDEDAWRLQDFEGTVGDSDLAGDIEVQTLRDPRPLIVADLVSRRLDLDDLGGLIGAAPDTGKGETESGGQEVEARTETRSKTVLPRDPIDLSSLGSIDADVTFNGKRVETGLPIDDLRMEVKLDDGRLTFRPLDFGVGGGTIKSRLKLDGSTRPVEAEMKTEVRRVNLKEILRGSGFAQDSVGNIGGRANLKATGDSIADLMAALDGQLSLIMTGGQFNSLLIELAGIDVGEAITDFFADEEAVPIRCAFTDLKANDGQIDIASFVIDTVDTKFTGAGAIDLDKEGIDFVIVPHPKDFSLFTARSPLHVGGRFGNPAFYIDTSDVAGRLAASVALGVVATPLAALIPFIETGSGEDAACQSLLDASEDEERTAESNPGREGEPPPSEGAFIRPDSLE